MEEVNFSGKVLLITGGTGSFGNAVLRRFLSIDVGEIRIFSRDEKKQDDMRESPAIALMKLLKEKSAVIEIALFLFTLPRGLISYCYRYYKKNQSSNDGKKEMSFLRLKRHQIEFVCLDYQVAIRKMSSFIN
jgi:hypothetical protein